jgi:ribose-phosphate pyrophosphokinase
MRQDAAFHVGESVSAKHFAKLFSRSFDALVTVDPHLHRIHALSDLYAIETRIVRAAPAVAKWVGGNVPDPIIIGPDSESEQWVKEIAVAAGCPYIVLEKERLGDRDVKVAPTDMSAVRGRTPVLVDDIISTGRTMIAAANQLRSAGLPAPVCIGVHAIFAAQAYLELQSAAIARIVTCNTIAHPSNGIDLRPLLGQEIATLSVR